jgi:predicted esterase YcpF (UPF0227 family)
MKSSAAVTAAQPPTPALIYLHGFLSSPRSAKAQLLGEYLRRNGLAVSYRVPELPDEPDRAFAAAAAACGEAIAAGHAPVALVGSSMGGFYATVLAQRSGLRAVLINPAVSPHRTIHRHFGVNVNPYSGRRFALDQRHAAELEALAPAAIAAPERLWLLAQTGDEVLDYRAAAAFYAGCRQTIEPGGDHRFQGFERYLPALLKFLQCAPE